MRKVLVVLLGLLAVLGLMVAPVGAQDSNIVEVAQGAGMFNTLLAAAEAAGLVETLSGEGPLTVFAPTDEAFAAALEALGLTAEQVLADTGLLTTVLTYHVVPGKLFIGQIATSDSLETVQGESITVSNVGGSLQLDGRVGFVATNIEASNGIVHVIDGVLLPPTVAASLGLPAPGAAPAEAPAEEMAADTLMVRVAHFSPDAPAVDIFINGERSAITGLEFPTVTDWVELPAGTYDLAVAASGSALADAVISVEGAELPAGAYITIAAIGSLSAGTLSPAVLIEDYSPIADGSARVSVFHGIEGAPQVNVLAGGAAVISQLAYPGTLGNNDGMVTIDVPAGSYDLQVVTNTSPSSVVLDLPGTELMAGMNYFVAAVGTPTEPQVVVVATEG
jgi:uncharacterized surface protein with fasciclin (FAS1) repeats